MGRNAAAQDSPPGPCEGKGFSRAGTWQCRGRQSGVGVWKAGKGVTWLCWQGVTPVGTASD